LKALALVAALAAGALLLALAACSVFDPAVGPVRDAAAGPSCIPPDEDDAGAYGSTGPASGGDDAENYCDTGT
jgi:hypothetical protein